jgi:zinc/manganese transport system substrate-binding protein
VVVLVVALCAGACGSTGRDRAGARASSVLPVAATINAWGSVLSQLGGTHVRARSIITNPNTDPHDYEPTPADARVIAGAKVFVENGVGYDAWAARVLAADPDSSRAEVNVGDLVGVADGGNPHRWYSPSDVERVADAITAQLKHADPADAAYFDAQRGAFDKQGLARYHQLIDQIRHGYAGTPIGASESVVAPLADALGLDLITPASFLKAISQGSEPSSADKATVDAQISDHQIKVYVFNKQNSTPDVAAQVKAARTHDIPVVAVTETLTPKNATFQDWQSGQLQALAAALRTAAAK